jgi:hypothetical protein
VYIAASAQCSSSCTVVAGAGVVETPIPTPTRRRTPVTVNGWSSSSRSRSARTRASSTLGSGSRTANSAPPSRGDDVLTAQGVAQPGPDLAQQVIAGGMPEAVVDLGEPVEVEQRQGSGPGGGRLGDHALGRFQHGVAVGQPGARRYGPPAWPG